MSNFSEWWNALSGLQQIYWAIAIPFSIIFIIMLILTFIGGDADTHVDMDVDTEIDSDTGLGFHFFTIKNFVAFFTLFSWTGIACLGSGLSTGMTLFISVGAGLGMMLLMASLFYFFGKLADSGTLNINNAKGAIGEVYLPIMAKRGNIGKVQITVQGSLRELEAISDDEGDLPMGTVVTVLDVINNHLLVVTKS